MGEPARRSAVIALGLGCVVAALLVHGYPLYHPALFCDDFESLMQSRTWADAWGNLWLPTNEHAMPLGRLTTWALAALAPRAADLPRVLAAQGPVALLLGLPLVYLFVRRELGHPFYGLLAMALFGVSSLYAQAVYWFSASFSVLSLDMTLLALLAAQRGRQTGRRYHLLACAGWAALAPAWFAIGVLAGPLCCLYLLPGQGGRRKAEDGRKTGFLFRLVPLLGTAAFLAVSLPRTAEHILHLEHYGHETALQAFHPLTGLVNTGRSVVDNLLLGATGVSLEGVCPLPGVVAVLLVAAGVGAWWWWGAPRRRLLLLGLGFIFSSYLLVYSARAKWSYDEMAHAWCRYHLFPQLGLALFVCGGLPRGQGRLGWLDPAGALSGRQTLGLALLFAILLLTQLPRGVIGAADFYAPEQVAGLWNVGWRQAVTGLLTVESPSQVAALSQVDAVDARCRQHHVGRETALAALGAVGAQPGGEGWLEIPGACERENGWLLLRGSPEPRPLTVDAARRLLTEATP